MSGKTAVSKRGIAAKHWVGCAPSSATVPNLLNRTASRFSIDAIGERHGGVSTLWRVNVFAAPADLERTAQTGLKAHLGKPLTLVAGPQVARGR